jgi:hypothetical protein
LANNFSNLLENFKQQALPNQSDSPHTSHGSENDLESPARSSFSPFQPADESTSELMLNPTVQVKHRSRYRRTEKSSASQTDHKGISFEEAKTENEIVCVENLDKLLGGQFFYCGCTNSIF